MLKKLKSYVKCKDFFKNVLAMTKEQKLDQNAPYLNT